MIIESFKYGTPRTSAAVLEVDCRTLRPVDFVEADGRDVRVQQRLLEANRGRIIDLIQDAYQVAKADGNVAFGCKEGRYQSVAMAEMLARVLRENGFSPTVRHTALPD